jgi:hypothetical protein
VPGIFSLTGMLTFDIITHYMNSIKGPENNQPTKIWNLALVGILGQVGVITLVIILAALFAGLWLDARFMTRPMFTLIFLIVSIPVSLLVMLAVVRFGLARLNIRAISNNQTGKKEESFGKHS